MKYIIESYWQKAAKKSQQKKQKKQNWENSMRNKYGSLWDDLQTEFTTLITTNTLQVRYFLIRVKNVKLFL